MQVFFFLFHQQNLSIIPFIVFYLYLHIYCKCINVYVRIQKLARGKISHSAFAISSEFLYHFGIQTTSEIHSIVQIHIGVEDSLCGIFLFFSYFTYETEEKSMLPTTINIELQFATPFAIVNNNKSNYKHIIQLNRHKF